MRKNIILMADAYKYGHKEQLPITSGYMHSYVEPRIGGDLDEAVVLGLQAFIREYLSFPITEIDIDEAEGIINSMGLDFNRVDWEIILREYNGFLPIEIRALPEGTVVPLGVPIAVIKNTDPRFYWLPAFVETALLRATWYPSTVASSSYNVKKTLLHYANETVGSTEHVEFQLHDFGARGVSSEESAQLGGMGHLLVFSGTDTVCAIRAARQYYDAQLPVGFSVPASEHSTMIAWGKDGEHAAYLNMLEKFGKPGSIVSVVSDSYDIFAATRFWFGQYDRIKEIGCRLVIRPDSGDPATTLTEMLKDAEAMLSEHITLSDKGYKQLPDCFGILWGDGINPASIKRILMVLKGLGWASNTVVFGMGGGLLQNVDRDVLNYACKSSYIEGVGLDGENFSAMISKNPLGDDTKKSKSGVIEVKEDGDSFIVECTAPNNHNPVGTAFRTVYNNTPTSDEKWDEVRSRLQAAL